MSYEYEFVPITSFDPIKKADTIAAYTERGWRVHSVNQDFTMALLEREKPTMPPAVGVAAVPHDIRITDSVPLVSIQVHHSETDTNNRWDRSTVW